MANHDGTPALRFLAIALRGHSVKNSLLLLAFFVSALSAAYASAHVAYLSGKRAGVPVKAVVVDLNTSAVKVSAVTSRRLGRAESVYSLLARSQPTVAMCGTFFCVKSKIPVGDIVIGGELQNFGGIGSALCITPDNQAAIISPKYGRRADWSEYEFVLGAGIRLLENGRRMLDPRAQRFRDRHVWQRNARTAVGITAHNKLVFAVTRHRVSLRRLADVMRSLGAVDAINLDGGGSVCLYYRKKLLIAPNRRLTNLLVVYDDPAKYIERRERLAPSVAKK